jgi:hypothetical protein
MIRSFRVSSSFAAAMPALSHRLLPGQLSAAQAGFAQTSMRYQSTACAELPTYAEPMLGTQTIAPKAHVLSAMARHISDGAEDPFFIVDIDAVRARVDKWYDLLPRVEPFYAVKCQPDVELIRTLAGAGVNFDCASRAEIDLILRQGVDPSRIIYANPCKQPNQLRYASAAGVNLSTFDSEAELVKTAACTGSGHELVLRIKVDDSRAQCVMSEKYGAPLSAAHGLLCRAADLGLRVRGVSFHVGSGCLSAQAYVAAVQRADQVFKMAADMGLPMDPSTSAAASPVSTPPMSLLARSPPRSVQLWPRSSRPRAACGSLRSPAATCQPRRLRSQSTSSARR